MNKCGYRFIESDFLAQCVHKVHVRVLDAKVGHEGNWLLLHTQQSLQQIHGNSELWADWLSFEMPLLKAGDVHPHAALFAKMRHSHFTLFAWVSAIA